VIIFKSYQDLEYNAFYSCYVFGCELEAEKIYATESKIVDVCSNHYKELLDRDYK